MLSGPFAGNDATLPRHQIDHEEVSSRTVKKTPRETGAFVIIEGAAKRSGGGLLGRAVNHLRGRSARADRNRARLLRLGNFANEIDVEQAVLERGVLHLHEVGKLEYTLEGARGDAAIQHLGLVLVVLVGDFLTLD